MSWFFSKSAVAGGIADDFNRADGSLGANWTAAAGASAIFSNTMRMTNATAHNFNIYSAQATATVNQYVKLKITAMAGGTPVVILRYTNSSSPFYFLYLAADTFWSHLTSVGGTETDVDNAALTYVAGDVLGITITGTGTSTVVRVWRNPTGDAPNSASDWGGDTTPDIAITTNPASPVDTGNLVGLGGYQNDVNLIQLDDFFAGDIP